MIRVYPVTKTKTVMEFQVYTVALEDRYPKGFAQGTSKSNLFAADFHELVENVEKDKEGCIAFVFGRAQDGRSVCVRVEGVRPKLFYEMKEGDTVPSIRRELEQEVKAKLASSTGLQVEVKHFAHDYGYEYDPCSPSGRKVHQYAEVRYPSLVTWRMACKLRRKAMFKEIGSKIKNTKAQMDSLSTQMLTFRKSRMTGNGDTDSMEFANMEARERALHQSLEGLQKRESALHDEEFGEEDVEVERASQQVRFAHEYFVEPITRFLFEASITPSRWTSVPSSNVVDTRVTVCDIELHATIDDFTPVERDLDAPYTVLYYDIETLGLDPETQPVIQISMVFVTNGVREKHLLAIGTVKPIPGVIVQECKTEADILLNFRHILLDKDPDFIVAYNGVNFDNRYLALRAKGGKAQVNDLDDFWYMSRFAFRPSRLRELRLSSSGMGDNLLRYIDMPGRVNLDWFVKLKRDLTSEPKYSLNHFAKKFCGMQKEDMNYKEIPVLHAGTAEDRARLGSYCVVDSDLLEDLNQARTMLVEILQFSAVFGVIAEWVYFRGQQVRFISILLAKARQAESVPLLLNRPPEGFFGEGVSTFEGATVNEPKRGFYKDKPVATLDWMSLYPSIMRAYNLCHSTHVFDPNMFGAEGVVAYQISEGETAHFVNSTRHKGILPRILEELHTARKGAKMKVTEYTKLSKETSLTPDECKRYLALAKVFDGRQLALKVSANSIYGACGATDTGKFPDLAISATVTLQGREAMKEKKRILPEHFPGIDVIYGDTDSVMVTFADAFDPQTCGIRGAEASDFVTKHFAKKGYPEMILEYEKCYFPYLLEGKKRYAGLKYDPDGSCKGIDCKGIETERRDTLPFVKDIMHECLDVLMYKRDEKLALASFQLKMRAFIDGEVEFDKFIMCKNLSSKAEKKPDQIVQARVNALRKQREPGSEAAINEQVEYVIVNGWKKENTTQLAEDPEYARKEGLKLNLLWYFEHAIREPVKKMFGPFEDMDIVAICKNYSDELDGKRLGVSNVLRNLMRPSSEASSSDVPMASVKHHIPKPPPARKRPKGK